MIVEIEFRRVEFERGWLLFGDVVEVLQLIEAFDQLQRVVGNLIVILNVDLTDVVVDVPVGSIDDQRVVVLVGKGEARDFVVHVEYFDDDLHAR